jgi:hypothetical protein
MPSDRTLPRSAKLVGVVFTNGESDAFPMGGGFQAKTFALGTPSINVVEYGMKTIASWTTPQWHEFALAHTDDATRYGVRANPNAYPPPRSSVLHGTTTWQGLLETMDPGLGAT